MPGKAFVGRAGHHFLSTSGAEVELVLIARYACADEPGALFDGVREGGEDLFRSDEGQVFN
ncbi:MAG: hypothetical protein EBY17_27440 [Acidobacteriia bacterium]|nr:hypothetical protein [Terriglobia bacterium]